MGITGRSCTLLFEILFVTSVFVLVIVGTISSVAPNSLTSCLTDDWVCSFSPFPATTFIDSVCTLLFVLLFLFCIMILHLSPLVTSIDFDIAIADFASSPVVTATLDNVCGSSFVIISLLFSLTAAASATITVVGSDGGLQSWRNLSLRSSLSSLPVPIVATVEPAAGYLLVRLSLRLASLPAPLRVRCYPLPLLVAMLIMAMVF